MTHNEISPDEAVRALSEVADRRHQVAAAAAPFPTWYWPAMGVIALLLCTWGDVPTSSTVSVGGQLLFLVGWFVVFCIAVFRQPVRPDPALFGLRARALIALVTIPFAASIAVVGFVTLDLARSAGIPLPNTATGIVLGLLCVVGGKLVQRLEQWIQVRFVRDVAS